MAPPNGVKTAISCNYLGESEGELRDQLAELNNGLHTPIIAIEADASQDHYCAYQSKEVGDFIGPVSFQTPFRHLEGWVYEEGSYLYFPIEVIPEEIKKILSKEAGEQKVPYQISGYRVLIQHKTGYDPQTEAFDLEETALQHFREDLGAEIIASEMVYVPGSERRPEFFLYLAGYNLPDLPKPKERNDRLKLEPSTCPEYLLHQPQVKSDVAIEGWVFLRRGEGTYLAMPREEIRQAALGFVNPVEQHRFDLESRLGNHVFMSGDNPIRLLKEIRFAGDEGVVGLMCPQFEVTIEEIEKSADNCLAWVERKKEAEVRQGKEVFDYKEGFVISLGSGHFKYITAMGKADLSGVEKFVEGKSENRKGYEKIVTSQPVVEDPVCSAYELKTTYREIPKPVVEKKSNPLPRGVTDKDKLLERFRENPGVQKKLRQLGELGEIIWAPPAGKELGQDADLIAVIKRKIHEATPKERMEIFLAVDGSGSMKDDTEYVRDKLGEVVTEMKSSAKEGSLGLLGFVDADERLLVSMKEGASLDDDVGTVGEGLTIIANTMNGGLEYFYEAAAKALDDIEAHGKPNAIKKILLLTDEEGDFKENGETVATIRKRADRLGVQFEILFIADSGGMDPRHAFLHYLETAGINPGMLSQEERMNLWERMLGDPQLSLDVKPIVIEKVAREKHPESLQVLIQALKNPEEHVRFAAAKSLGSLEDPRSLAPLLETLKDPVFYVRQVAAESLGKLKDPRSVAPLVKTLKDPVWKVRSAAAEALGNLKDPRSLAPLLEALKDPSSDVIAAVAGALGELKDSRSLDPLLETFKHRDIFVRSAAVRALGKLKAPRSLELLLEALKDPSFYVRREAAESLGKLKDPRSLTPLLEALKDPSTEVSGAVAETLGSLKDPRSLAPLLEALQDPEWPVRSAAARALGGLEDQRSLAPLLEALNDPEGRVRSTAARALRKLKDPRSLTPLLEALKDPYVDVRLEAAVALGEIGNREAIPHLSDLLHDHFSEVLQAATDAIEAIEARDLAGEGK